MFCVCLSRKVCVTRYDSSSPYPFTRRMFVMGKAHTRLKRAARASLRDMVGQQSQYTSGFWLQRVHIERPGLWFTVDSGVPSACGSVACFILDCTSFGTILVRLIRTIFIVHNGLHAAGNRSTALSIKQDKDKSIQTMFSKTQFSANSLHSGWLKTKIHVLTNTFLWYLQYNTNKFRQNTKSLIKDRSAGLFQTDYTYVEGLSPLTTISTVILISSCSLFTCLHGMVPLVKTCQEMIYASNTVEKFTTRGIGGDWKGRPSQSLFKHGKHFHRKITSCVQKHIFSCSVTPTSCATFKISPLNQCITADDPHVLILSSSSPCWYRFPPSAIPV